jgi:hypothetical protein
MGNACKNAMPRFATTCACFWMTPPFHRTNNSSEQAIRMSTVFRKVTNGFRSEWGRDLFAAVRSVVNTGKRHGLSAYQAIQKALSPIGSLFEPG